MNEIAKEKGSFFPVLSLWILIGAVGRIIPHIPNVTPLTSMGLLAGAMLVRRQALFVILITLFSSDVMLSVLFHYPLFSGFTFFTYSGFLVITLFGNYLSLTDRFMKGVGMILLCSFFYWVWTNFGVWVIGNLYMKNVIGLYTCFVAALPFLRNAMLGSFVWFSVLFGFLKWITLSHRERGNLHSPLQKKSH